MPPVCDARCDHDGGMVAGSDEEHSLMGFLGMYICVWAGQWFRCVI